MTNNIQKIYNLLRKDEIADIKLARFQIYNEINYIDINI